MKHLSARISLRTLLLLAFVTCVATSICPDPLPCNRDGDECSDVQKYVDCIEEKGQGCPKETRDRHEVSIKIIKRAYAGEPFNCVITSGSSRSPLRIGIGITLVATAVLSKYYSC